MKRATVVLLLLLGCASAKTPARPGSVTTAQCTVWQDGEGYMWEGQGCRTAAPPMGAIRAFEAAHGLPSRTVRDIYHDAFRMPIARPFDWTPGERFVLRLYCLLSGHWC